MVSSNGGFAKVELRPMFSELSFNIIMRMMTGKRYYGSKDGGEEGKEFRELIEEMFEYAGASNPADFLPILKWFDYQGHVKRAVSIGKKMDSFLQGLIDEHRNAAAEESRNTMISHLLVLQQSQPDYYTDEIIKGLVILLGATDTSAATLEWTMSNLLNHPSPLMIPHLSLDDCTVEGYYIPGDTMLIVNAWAIQRDPKNWDDPTSFKPERFESGESMGYKFMPFGRGRRACPGEGMAQRVLGLTSGLLIQCFDWTRVDDKEVYMRDGKGLTMPRVVPLEAMCKARPIFNKAFSKAAVA
ncbi:hypothetical protein EZV62_013928 [Acer yangbiense]|uniref:Cytochrome P450 n=1 Tax=Acer yangbiense TaxID=1000413 RepID=A0A5C7HRC2_9ROSI|nr:hypothetical protein EZV62_013928 [Acer yangbiense]